MYTEHPLTPYTQGAFGAIHDRQVADFGASYRKTSRLNDGTGEVVKGEVSVLKAGEIVVFPNHLQLVPTKFKMVLYINLKVGDMIFERIILLLEKGGRKT